MHTPLRAQRLCCRVSARHTVVCTPFSVLLRMHSYLYLSWMPCSGKEGQWLKICSGMGALRQVLPSA